jgi:adenosylcobinamide kinase/adenosylcobinamide-phosphate guanylyltransferase
MIGGARSGKSRLAESLAAKMATRDAGGVTFVATAQALDSEMTERIARHRQDRPPSWTTVEEPIAVSTWLRSHDDAARIVVVDCLTLLLSNWMFLNQSSEDQIWQEIRELTTALSLFQGQVIVVTNQVGEGIVPNDPVSRQYRDWLGILNQRVAAVADEVFLVVAGIPIEVRQFEAAWNR